MRTAVALTVLAVGLAACGASTSATGGGTAEDDPPRPASANEAGEVGAPPTALPDAEPFFWVAGTQPEASVPLEEIRAGGPPPDGIPPIDDPSFVAVDEASEWLPDVEPVMVVERGSVAKAYPLRILTFHEIVNDVIDGQPTVVTYCPLCNSGLAFDPTVRGATLDFGTSGRLWRSNLVMYDRQTQSLWSQFTGEAIVGPLLGETLERVPLGLVSFADFAEAHPDGVVLSQDTGFDRSYGQNPYTGYDEVGSQPFLFDGETDDVLPQMARVVTLGDEADPVAIPLDALQEQRVITATVDGHDVVALWSPGVASALDTAAIEAGDDVGATGVFVPEADGRALTFTAEGEDRFTDEETRSAWNVLGQAVEGPLEGAELERVAHDDTFWFVQFAFRPVTRIVS